ncbi:hypothetical protein DW683_07025 [Bacteroides sp. AM25-34]|nr:hypothetical protein DW683_07025 [Bacteroides sp. AM25-34]
MGYTSFQKRCFGDGTAMPFRTLFLYILWKIFPTIPVVEVMVTMIAAIRYKDFMSIFFLI